MKIIKTKEIEMFRCDCVNCGEELRYAYHLNGKDYCSPHFDEVWLSDHKHTLKYEFYGWEGSEAYIEKYCDTNRGICKYEEKKVLFDKKPNKKELLEVIYENKDLFDLLVEKMKGEENERK